MLNMLIDLQERAKQGGIKFQAYDARGPSDFDAAFEAMIKAREDALLVFPSPMFYVNYQRLVDLATAHQLPTMWVFREGRLAALYATVRTFPISHVGLAYTWPRFSEARSQAILRWSSRPGSTS